MQHPAFTSRCNALALALAIVTASGCAPAAMIQTTPPGSAIAPAALSGPLGTATVDLKALAGFFNQRQPRLPEGERHIAYTMSDFAFRVSQARLVVTGPGIREPLSDTVSWDTTNAIESGHVPGAPADRLTVRVPAGLNRVFTLQALDGRGNVIGYVKGVGTVEAGQAMTVRFDFVETAIANTLEYLLAGPGAGDEADVQGIKNSLTTSDLTAELRAFITTVTGYRPSNNTFGNPTLQDGQTSAYASVNPAGFRSRFLANQLRMTGRSFLAGLPPMAPGGPSDPYAIIATEARYTMNLDVAGMRALPGSTVSYETALCGPTYSHLFNVVSGTATAPNLYPGTYTVAIKETATSPLTTQTHPGYAWDTITVEESLSDAPQAQTATVTFTPPPIQLESHPATVLRGNLDSTAQMCLNPADHEVYARQKVDGNWIINRFDTTTNTFVPAYDTTGLGATMYSFTFDSIGTLYLALGDHTIRKAVSDGQGGYTYPIVAGASGQAGYTNDEQGHLPAESTARFNFALFGSSLSVQLASSAEGEVYIVSLSSHGVRKLVDTNGQAVVTTIAGPAPGQSPQIGLVNGPGAQARFAYPYGVATAPNGGLYVHDLDNFRIRKLVEDANGAFTVSTLFGGVYGTADGEGLQAEIDDVFSPMTSDRDGNMYIADRKFGRVRKATPAGVVTTVFAPADPETTWSACVDDAGDLLVITLNQITQEYIINKVTL